jgi:hypothetical protein
MNMILHDNPTALIVQGNTLADPKFKDGDTLKTFDYVIANPPFSDKRWSTGLDPLNDFYQRFQPFGTPPAKQGDYAYLLHIVRSLKSTGKGACILPHGVPRSDLVMIRLAGRRAPGILFGTTAGGGVNGLGTVRDRQDHRQRLLPRGHQAGQLQRHQRKGTSGRPSHRYRSSDLLEILPVALLLHPADLALGIRAFRLGAGSAGEHCGDNGERNAARHSSTSIRAGRFGIVSDSYFLAGRKRQKIVVSWCLVWLQLRG